MEDNSILLAAGPSMPVHLVESMGRVVNPNCLGCAGDNDPQNHRVTENSASGRLETGQHLGAWLGVEEYSPFVAHAPSVEGPDARVARTWSILRHGSRSDDQRGLIQRWGERGQRPRRCRCRQDQRDGGTTQLLKGRSGYEARWKVRRHHAAWTIVCSTPRPGCPARPATSSMSSQTEPTFSPRCFFVVFPTTPKHTAKRTENPKATQRDGTKPAGTFGSPTLSAMMVQSKLMAAPNAAAAHVDAKSVSASPSSPVRRLSRIQSPCPIIKCSPCGTLNVVEVSSCRSSSSGDMTYDPSPLSDSACSIAGSCSA